MSGHSKWSTIKRKKAANDAKRGKIFTRLAREITIAAREGGGDPDTNFSLRLAVDRAKAENMPKENIDRAIKSGTGELKDAAAFEEILYEAYGPSGVAIMIAVATDNRNRSLADIKYVLNRYGGSMAEPGSVSWQFEQKGYIAVNAGQMEFDDLFLLAADAGAEDIVDGEELVEIYTPREKLQAVTEEMKANGLTTEEARLDWVPNNELDLAADDGAKVMKVIEMLEDLDDAQMVYSNLNVTDELIAALEA